MAAKWQVRLITKPATNDFRADFFPRGFCYKRDAEELKREVESKGGVAIVERVPVKK